mgnify:CR=1 FL=1
MGEEQTMTDPFDDNRASHGPMPFPSAFPPSIPAIKAMIRKAAERAKEHGTYIIIGHCRPHTAEAFRQMVPQLEAEGTKFIYVSSLMN